MTYTLLAAGTGGALGAVSASRSLAVGASTIGIDPTCGVVASQAWTNRRLRDVALRSLPAGAEAAVADAVRADPDPAWRQLAALDRDGGTAHFTGQRCGSWAGALAERGVVAVGNLLAGPAVLRGLVDGFAAPDPDAFSLVREAAADESDTGPVDAGGSPDRGVPGGAAELAIRLLAAAGAAEAAGGDLRGRQSAAIVVAEPAERLLQPPELIIDLRVDDHAEPVRELARLLALRLGHGADRAEEFARSFGGVFRARSG